MDGVKEAFLLVKEDISFLKQELNLFKKSLANLNYKLYQIEKNIKHLNFQQINRQTNQQINSTNPTHNPTDIYPLNSPKAQNIAFSIRNEGVPTDSQTDSQTVQQTDNSYSPSKNQLESQQQNKSFNFSQIQPISEKILPEINPKPIPLHQPPPIQTNSNISLREISLSDTSEILSRLDYIKKDLRLRFKRLTPQEMLIFSTLYQFQEEGTESTYNSISIKLNLSESSIRDYIQRIIKKGIIIDKTKINNKKILLKISENITKIASLSTIIQLREI